MDFFHPKSEALPFLWKIVYYRVTHIIFAWNACRMSQTLNQIGVSLSKAICDVANPRQLILFGSQARGEAGSQSDVDVLVVEEKENWKAPTRRQEIGRLRRAIPRIGFPVDVLLFTPSEVDRWRNAKNHVIAEALERGVRLYERP